MFPIHLKLTIGTVAELQAVAAFLATHAAIAVASRPTLEENAAALTGSNDKADIVKQAPGKSSPASPARGPRTAAAEVQAPAAPEKTVAASSPAAEPAAAPPPASTAADEPAFEYATLQKVVVAAVPKFGKPALTAIAVKHGAPDFKTLPASAWQAAYNDVIALG